MRATLSTWGCWDRAAIALCVAALCLASACCPAETAPAPASAAVVVTNNGGAPIVGPQATACPPDQALLSGRCFSMANTAWMLSTAMPDGHRVFQVDFLPGGRTTSHDPVDTTTDNDEWEQQGTAFRFWFNQRFVVHETTLTNEQQISGTTLNVRGQRWTWSATRVR